MTASMELPLVAFTILSQAAVGLCVLHAATALTAAGPATGRPRPLWLLAAALLGLGLFASLAHLGHPAGAPRAILHLSTSWLSREALLFGVLVAMMGATALLGAPKALAMATAGLGLAGLFVQGMVYAPPALPALANALPFAIFLVTAITLGAGMAVWLTPAERHGALRTILIAALAAGLVLFLAAPSIWSSGGTVMRMTAAAYFASPFYWTHIVLGLALPLGLLVSRRAVPSWLPVLLLAGAVSGRIAFYLETVHSAANIGGLY